MLYSPGHHRYQEQRPVDVQHAGSHPLLLRDTDVVVHRIRSNFFFLHTSLLNRAETSTIRIIADVSAPSTANTTSATNRHYYHYNHHHHLRYREKLTWCISGKFLMPERIAIRPSEARMKSSTNRKCVTFTRIFTDVHANFHTKKRHYEFTRKSHASARKKSRDRS